MIISTTYFASALFIASFFAASCDAQVPVVRKDRAASQSGSISAISNMTVRRSVHTATLLRDGKVLVAGGYIGGEGNISSAELFDPATNEFVAVGSMRLARSSHSATLLADGKVLVAGGFNGEYLDTTEIYDPSTKQFVPGPRMTSARSGHIATAFNDGTILIAGGVGTGWTFLKSAEIYDPLAKQFSAVDDMSLARESHTATLLKDGRILIVGGHNGRRSQVVIYSGSEIYDPRTRRFTEAGDLSTKRHKHEAIRLTDGRVLILGGSDERDGDGAYNNAEVYDPANGKFTAVKNKMNATRYKLQGTAVVLPSGKVLVAGGSNRAEVFDPATNSFVFAEGDMGTIRLFATATLLGNGTVLITGGYRDGRNISDGAWIYRT